MIIWLNLLAFGGLEAVFLWPLVLGLYWERANAQGALSSMVSGAVCYTLLASFNLQPAGLHPIVPSLLLSLLAFYLGNVVGESAGRRHHYPLEENCYALDQLKLNTTGSGRKT